MDPHAEHNLAVADAVGLEGFSVRAEAQVVRRAAEVGPEAFFRRRALRESLGLLERHTPPGCAWSDAKSATLARATVGLLTAASQPPKGPNPNPNPNLNPNPNPNPTPNPNPDIVLIREYATTTRAAQ